MSRTVHFAVSPRLTALLGETYRLTEAALKELVDNGWDADADNIWVTLPKAMTTDPIIVKDDGSGMSPAQLESEYLDIARDRRSTKGDYSPRLKRRIKGRKGIGKFAGLAAARDMLVETVCDGVKSQVSIDKQVILNAADDLERIPLPLTETSRPRRSERHQDYFEQSGSGLELPERGAASSVASLRIWPRSRHQNLCQRTDSRCRGFPGETTKVKETFTNAGEVRLRFTIAEGKPPKHAGFLLRVGGKVVGRPQWFGLDENREIPEGLRKRVYGEIEVDGIDGVVTSDWGALIENSKAYEEISGLVRDLTTTKLKTVYAKEMNLQQARLKQEIDRRLQNLPEHRRAFAEAALEKVLVKFYGERQERIETVASVVLDAMERDEYWQVLRNIDEARNGDVSNFADALEQFGLVELTRMAESAHARLRYLAELDALAAKPATLEAQMHKAIEKSLWVLGGAYYLMSSNETLARTVEEYAKKKFRGKQASKRPDLLLSTDPGDRYLLIEFKRPTHPITRKDEAQAQIYADELHGQLPAKPFDIIVIGGKRVGESDPRNDAPNMSVWSYGDVISKARHEVQWLLSTALRSV